jgi:hypothetical protein
MNTARAELRLPIDLYSADQLSAAMLELHDYIGVLRDEAVRAKAKGNAARADSMHISAFLLGLFHGAGLAPDDRAAAESLLHALEIIRSKAPIVHITLPALPNRTFKRKLTVWFRSEVHQHTFLTFTTRSDIGGGIMVQAGSHLYDFSFRQQLLGNKHRIAEIFNGV